MLLKFYFDLESTLPKVLRPVTTVTDFFFPLGALETVTNRGTSSFFLVFSMPLPPRFCRFFSSSPPPASIEPSSTADQNTNLEVRSFDDCHAVCQFFYNYLVLLFRIQ